ncbi:MAG: ATPase [Chromatiales bacterium]|nr:ATPase [Chromatiales bacterium]
MSDRHDDFLHPQRRRVTLLGMSGVGKTQLAKKLPRERWFHYSGDYRIGTRYLDEPILDDIKRRAMAVPFLRDLLRSDSIYIGNNISFDNLDPISKFLGKLGDPAQDGLSLAEFKRRQHLHREAEIRAMLDVPGFIVKAREIYGYEHFLNDAGGSVCELDDETVLETLAAHTLIVYIETDAEMEMTLIERAQHNPKPLYYREAFLDEQLPEFMREHDIRRVEEIAPDSFVSWVFPRLVRARLPRYRAIAERYGCTIRASESQQVRDEGDLIELLGAARERCRRARATG